jgi:phosphodiesterase/alkaline phosphatase D-like protein
LWPFKRYWQEALALILLICFVFSSIFWYHPQVALGATYYWVQTDWSGGATTTSAVHPNNREGWNYYSSTTIGTGSLFQTSDTDFNAGSFDHTKVVGTGADASVILTCGGPNGTCYRKPITIDNTQNSNTLTDYQVLVTLDTSSTIAAGKMRSDCGDIRFTDSDGVTNLNYWLESGCNTVSTKIWVKVPSIPASSMKTIYVYYGNPTATSQSSITNTFIREITGLVGSWHFDEGSGTIAYDTSGNGNNGNIYNGATWVDGKFGKALSFDGADDYFVKSLFANFPTNEITVAFWMRSSDTTKAGTPFSYAISAVDNEFLIIDHRNFALWIGNGSRTTGVSASDGGWHHIVVTWRSSDGQLIFYKDGLPVFSGTLQAGYSMTSGGCLVIGQDQDSLCGGFEISQAFLGTIDEVHIYNIALSAAEISDLYSYYGYATTSYPGKTLVRKYTSPEPTTSVGIEENYYSPSGTFTSSILDTIGNTGFGTLVFTATTSASTTIKFQLRSGKTVDELNSRNFVGPDGSTSTYYLTSNTSIWSGHSGDRYIQYKAYLETTDASQTPYLNDVTINYYYIASSGTLISSPYDTSDSANVVAKIQWTATTPASTTIKFQIRTSPDGVNWTDWCGPDDSDDSTTTCSTSTYFTDPSGGEPIDEMFKDGKDDRWIQYKVILETEDPTKTPVLDDVSITYVVNAPPEFNPDQPPSVNVASSTEVQIYYSIRDPDTNEGSPQNQWKVWLANLEYSIDGGQTWIPISSSTITKPPNIGDYIPLGPSTSTWVATTTYWNAKAQNPNIYSTTTYIRITIDDHEAANNTAVATVGPFTLDTKDPQVGTPPGGGTGININQNATTSLGNDKTSTSSVTIHLSANDDSPLKMRIWENGGQDTGWVDYSPTYPFTLTSGDGLKTVYVKFKDSFGNEVGAYSDTIYLDTTPPEVKNPFVQDVSNSQTSEWRIFFNWAKATESDFTKYEVYFATSSTGTFELLKTITDKDLNYIIHENLTQGEQYCYKARYYDDLQNYSETSVLCQVAGGQPADTVPPEISNVAVSEITVSSAKITWQTNEPASTQVLYSVDNSFSKIQGVAGYDTLHFVTLVGLNASTTYNFKVRSCDASNNCSESSPSQFTTLGGDTLPPSISNISVSEITYNSAKISWITDEPSDSFVEYSTSSGFSYGIMVGSKESTTSHSVLLTNLNASTTYYFKVHSRDLAGNEAVSLESSFTTQSAPPLDTTPPTISNITVSNIQYNTALISWQTDEPASSYVEFGLSTSYGRIYGQDELVTFHSVQLPKDLTPDSTYHFRVRSRDAAGNEAISQDFTFTTAQNPQDTTPPTITFDPSTGIGQPSETQVTISWTTNEDSDSFIDYSTDKSFSLSQGSPQMTTQHSVTLVGLKPGTQYFFRIRSTDPSGNRAILDNNGQGFSFVTASGPNPPVISNIQITDVTYNSVKISWQTDIPSNSLLEYGFDTSYGKIAGQNDSTTSHSMTLTGLLSQATYHFRVRSKAQTEAVSQDYTFTTQPAPSITLAEQPGPPQISQVEVAVITHNSAVITWITNEPATSKVVFGISTSYGMETPEENILTIKHAVTLTGLNKETTYYFKVISKDSSGNESVDDNSGKGYTFTTTKEPGQVITVTVGGGVTTVIPPGYATKEQLCKEMGLYWYDNSCHKEPKEKKSEEKAKELEKEIEEFGVPELMQRASKASVTKVLESLPKNPFLKEIPEEKFITSVTEIAPKVVLAPQITGGAPQVEVGPDWVKISWVTDKKSNSLVALAKEKDYDPKKDEPYTMVVGNPDELVTSHTVTITGLEPATTYYFQVRSKPLVGPLAKSDNLTFKTLSKKLEISDITFTEISEREITLTFKTNLPSATKIFCTNLRTQEKKEFEDKSFLRDHALTLKDLEPNTEYSLVILAKEETGNEATSPTLTFSTGKDTTPPEISQVRTSLAISPRGDTVQVVITWLTNEPATSRVYFVQGASWKEELVKSTSLDKTLSIKHTVLLPALKPGQVYRFRAESIDSSGNVSLSKDFTFLTPQQKKTIIQIMISQFEKIFGWVKRIKF